ncbi:MAG: hypothetical protein ACUVS4_02890 [Chloroflexaceae bacterium]
MNHWAAWLSDLAPTLQRAIARAQRISLPRGCDPATRTLRLRQTLCHGRTVRATFFRLPPAARAALWALRDCPRGLTPAELVQRYGPVRPFSELRDDPAPRSISEHLLLLGWLLPRPATLRHPERWLLPPELRRWLPPSLRIATGGPAPAAPVAPALRAAVAVLSTAAEAPLAVHADARPTAATLHSIAPRLAPLTSPEVDDLLIWLLPLLAELHLLLPHGSTLVPSPAARTFLNLPADLQLQRLTAAWLRTPRPDVLLRRCLRSDAGLLWPALRRRLLAWAAALPTGRLLPAAELFPALTAAFGPLADATTHGLRVVRRSPWNPARAASVWERALAGPLTWLGVVAWAPAGEASARDCFVTRRAEAADAAPTTPAAAPERLTPWLYQANGRVRVPYVGAGAELLALPAFARWEAADAEGMVFRLDAKSLTRARSQGSPKSMSSSGINLEVQRNGLLWIRCGCLPSIKHLLANCVLMCWSGIFRIAATTCNDYQSWLKATSPQQSLFEEDAEVPNLSRSSKERFLVLKAFDEGCKQRKLGVSLCTKRGLWTPEPERPINFWLYEPQHPEDKAPSKNQQ